MPNARKKGKKFVGAWVPNKLYADLHRAAKHTGQPASEIIDALLTEYTAGADALRDAPNSADDPAAQAAARSIVSAAAAQSRDAQTAPPPATKPATYKAAPRSTKRKPPARDAK